MKTHEVTNQVPELKDVNLYSTDLALSEGVQREQAGWHAAPLSNYGAELGSADVLQLAELANRHTPELQTHDRFGNRIDRVDFHPSWHALLALLRREALHALPWMPAHEGMPGAHVARAAGYFLHAQVEAGSLCPTTMTFASLPVLRHEDALFPMVRDKLFSREHDPRDLPLEQKRSMLIGMGMTEKQGGSDVRSNTTVARPLNGSGRGAAYTLIGHKWFFSAPMSDAHMVLARTDNGLSCFFVPRWRPDGQKNGVLIQRLKDKLGNRSNSSSEVEFDDAYGVMVGDEGRGIPTIIEMANHTRLDCVIGSAGMMRYALIQAIHHARHRSAFGKQLAEQALMRNVLSDLALESEAATLLMLRLARAFESPNDPLQRAWRRIVTPAAKFWICKRALEFTGECMEVWGGNGYVETAPMARMYREAPVNSIWEGSGNVMCLDVLRAMEREPEGCILLLEELQQVADGHHVLQASLDALKQLLTTPPDQREMLARRLVQQLILTVQSALMLQHAPTAMAEAFVLSRSDAANGRVYGTLSAGTTDAASLQRAILERAWPS
ncbi:isovaleryl-CoA dehydrogenase [Herbaspirillum sp. meg3]|uniref:isovaleryl-CoA dehydrogenase n=1 Tax=Herbaspirillum sp. meg3 TaxID=2025949 RepID=UPI000B99B98A|nr:isovaleryl-CoA dehydrogenase [Herbaspirillum sp. meg3]ASU37840.1 isovaleryl-CoA dehydrogenase [Herbaspirillum sp. meg3]